MATDVMKLRVETGAVTVAVEDERGMEIGSFDFNPSDSNILSRYSRVVDFFNTISFDSNASDEEQIAQMDKLNSDIKAQFDYLLGYDVSEGVFGRCGPLTVTKNGDFFFEQVMEGVGGIIEKVTKKRLDKKMAKIRKAAAAAPGSKYHA